MGAAVFRISWSMPGAPSKFQVWPRNSGAGLRILTIDLEALALTPKPQTPNPKS